MTRTHESEGTPTSPPETAVREFVELAEAARRADRILPERAKALSAVPPEAARALNDALGARFEAQGRGARVGYKVGATTAAMQRHLGVDRPVGGSVHAADLYRSGADVARAAGAPVALECELAVRLGRDLPARDAPWRREELGEFVEAVAPAIEIVENRYGDLASTAIGTLIADDMFHKHAVIGPWRAYGSGLDLSGVRGEIARDGETLGSGSGADVLGHPLESVAWLAVELAARGRSLRAGELVLTGSMTVPLWLEALPARIAIRLSGIGECVCTLRARETPLGGTAS